MMPNVSKSAAPSDGDLRAVRQRDGPPTLPTKNRGQGSSNTSSVPRKEFLFKILVIGELGAGKTSLIKRYVHQIFSDHYRATIGVDFALKVFQWNDEEGTVIRLQLWDIAGQERFGNMTRVYYKEAVGAIVVYDVTRNDTFSAVDKWKADLDSKVLLPDGRPIPCILVGNKSDRKSEEDLDAESPIMRAYCQQKGFVDAFFVSAKTNENVEKACHCLVERILENEKWLDHSNSHLKLNHGGNSGNNGTDRTDGGFSLTEGNRAKSKASKCFEACTT